jgi:hypothetical protein
MTSPDASVTRRDEEFQRIPRHPTCENQCARCGSSVGHRDCENCGGDGYIEDDDWQFPSNDRCDICLGDGGWYVCLSSGEWCEAHPIPGRETVTRGTVEWFCVPHCKEYDNGTA